MKISASIYSNKTKPLTELVKELDNLAVDMLHVDCNDDVSVFKDIEQIRQLTDLPIDLHIITPTPEKYFDLLIKNPVYAVTFQYENVNTFFSVPDEITAKKGISIVTKTNIEILEAFKNYFDFFLIMTTTPGMSGGAFDKQNFKTIRQCKNRYPSKSIHVDGGVNNEIAFVLRNMGVSAVVSGSYLVNAENGGMGKALYNLRKSFAYSHILVSDIMLELSELPVILSNEINLPTVLKIIEQYKFGFVLVTDTNGLLQGIITNADVRKALIKNINNLNNIPATDLLNTSPAKISEQVTISQMLNYLEQLPFSALFLPVVNNNNQLTGAITFTNLIKGEL